MRKRVQSVFTRGPRGDTVAQIISSARRNAVLGIARFKIGRVEAGVGSVVVAQRLRQIFDLGRTVILLSYSRARKLTVPRPGMKK
jgi:hypothetical protein